MNDDPPIRIGSIVTVSISRHERDMGGYLGIVTGTNVWEPGGMRIRIPGIGEVETGRNKCYNATEEERKLYFKYVLKYGE